MKSRLILQQGSMEGKVIKEESIGSPCSPAPANTPSGKENRRVGSPLSTSEILTRSRSKGESISFVLFISIEVILNKVKFRKFQSALVCFL